MIASQEKIFLDIEKAVIEIKYSILVDSLVEPIKYILSLGGKRMRPMLVLNAYRLYKDNYFDIINEALSVEVFHNFTLMHDDIMDEAPIRRGKPTVHTKWNRNTAILSGDAMLVQSYELLKGLSGDKLSKVLSRFNKCAIEVCEGQQLDMLYEKRELVSIDEYLGMITLKTAVLLGFSLEMGAILADAPENDQKLLFQIGVEAGIGFQIMDDYLDIFGSTDKVGKVKGGDILVNKKTFLLCQLMSIADESDLKSINDWICKSCFDNQQKIDFFVSMYQKYDIPNLTRHEVELKYNKAIEGFSKLSGDKLRIGIIKNYLSTFMERVS